MISIIFNIVTIIALLYLLGVDKDSKPALIWKELLLINIVLLLINISVKFFGL